VRQGIHGPAPGPHSEVLELRRGARRARLYRRARHAHRGEGGWPGGGKGRDRRDERRRSPSCGRENPRRAYPGRCGQPGRDRRIPRRGRSELHRAGRWRARAPACDQPGSQASPGRPRGANTGGMGAYSPAPVVTPALHARVVREVIEPTVRGLAADGTPYTGFLYAGLMIAPDGTPRVLEFNCRLGDPETQPILMRLESDLTTLCEAALGGRLDALSVQWDPRAALGVVMAAAGYPERVRKGDVIEGLERAAQLPGKIFHAGTRLEAGRVL